MNTKTYNSLQNFIDAFYHDKKLEVRVRYNNSAVGDWELLNPNDNKKFFETLSNFASIEWRIKVPEYYHIGQVFVDVSTNQYYLLCQVEKWKVVLIHLSSGNRECDPVFVEYINKITEDQMINICGEDVYKNLEKIENYKIVTEIC